jgi:hypothetical protein
MANEMKDVYHDFFQQATEGFQAAMNAGMKFQQEMSRCWTGPFAGVTCADDVRRHGERVTTGAFDMIQKNMGECQKAFEVQCRNGQTIARKFVTSFPAESPDDFRQKATDCWQTTFEAVKASIEASTRSGLQAFENWTTFITKAFDGNESRKAAPTK